MTNNIENISLFATMANKMFETLEFNKIIEMLKEYAISDNAKMRIGELKPFLAEAEVKNKLNETTEAKKIIEACGNPPLSAMMDFEKILPLLGKGTFLVPEQLTSISQFLTSCRRLKSYLKKAESTFTGVAYYGDSIFDLSEIEEEINRCVRGSQLDDRASSTLADIRRKIMNSEGQVKLKLDALLRNNKSWFSEGFVSIRNGHYTLPVKREHKNQVAGTVIDMSQSGGTCFIEPSSVRKYQDELAILRIDEDNEIRRILYTLTSLVEENISYININIEAMETLDFIFAKAKLSLSMKAKSIPVTCDRIIKITDGRHPLLKPETAVPLNFYIGNGTNGVVITGPNTGGKTVALKTIGLLSLMAQSGLHVPVEDGIFSMDNYVLCDIGDGQSITENLSTFSSHITNIINILKLTSEQSLVLLDELGSGTDPAEGMGIAIAILEELKNTNCLFVATTHYPEIKEFAKNTGGLINARMAFDRQSLLPLYKLEIGEVGESCALYIAKRLGLPERMIKRASEAAYGHQNKPFQATKQKYDFGVNSDGSGDVDNERPKVNNTSEENLNKPNLCLVIKQENQKEPQVSRSSKFNIGDSVMVYPQRDIGIVYQKANERGKIGVQIKNKKILINHKRIKLHVAATELYPPDYDFSIIFDS